jgi:cytochrome o ubiquinol oxidase operon protein cyoD
MSHPALHGHSHETHIEGSGGAGHAGYGAYGVGFALSVILTLAAFYPVMVPGTLPAGWVIPTIAILAVVQIVVHLVCFLHMSAASEQRWNVVAFGFALLVVFILIVGSLWIMHNVSQNMMTPEVPAVGTSGHADQGPMNGM